ncbi:zinc-dependent alcohol dehydrogenase [Bryobacter aggregatus]|uniref:zinc-dependent alcohol dehydrogenase n=1 Tax=Bryobacter aggregatus TaxID=360054 RepID=UPI0004E14FFC|nr:zinc-dependent alcohol dehydrogenase [Bryobacter aggregatus]
MSAKGLAAIARKFHEPLSIEEMQFPDPAPNEVLVKMIVSGVCHTDLHAVNGDWPIQPPLPFVPGHEGVGIVVQAGSAVKNLKEGDRVGLPWLHQACGYCEWCLSGWETLCPKAVFGGYSANGSFAEYAIASAAYAIPIPADLSSKAAAPILCAGVTTWKALKQAELQAGNWVAISGIGGLGHLAIQYAQAMGLNIAAIDVADDKLALARSLQANLVIDARKTDPAEFLQQKIGGAHGVILTAPSQAAFREGLGMTRRKGTCVLVGLPAGDLPIPIFDMILRGITLRGSLVGTRNDQVEALSFASHAQVIAEIHLRPFREVNEALTGLANAKVTGRTVLTFE